MPLFGDRHGQHARGAVEDPLTHHDVEDPFGEAASLDPRRGSIGCKDIRYPGSLEMIRSNRPRNIPARMEMGDVEATRKIR